jgi:hypothetical protein
MATTALLNPMGGWPLLIASILIVDVIVMIVSRHTGMFGRVLNRWYDRFGGLAVAADVFIIAIGFWLARWIVATWFPGAGLGAFLGLLVLVQLIHDVLFYVGVILPFPRGLNAMMDVFKDYAAELGGSILVGDAGLMLASAGVFMALERVGSFWQVGAGLLALYALPFALTTRS